MRVAESCLKKAKEKNELKGTVVQMHATWLAVNTDAFLNKENMEYLRELLYEFDNRNLKNPIILITKCYIPEHFIKYIKQFKDNGHKIVIYLSLSGLSQEIEPNVNHDLIRENFVNLYKNGIDVIHYYPEFDSKKMGIRT